MDTINNVLLAASEFTGFSMDKVKIAYINFMSTNVYNTEGQSSVIDINKLSLVLFCA